MHVQLSGISKWFSDFQALKEVDFDLRRGEVHALVGENGAGKSTLMRILAGQLGADEGSLVIDGNSHEVHRQLTARREGVGFVEQEGGLILELNAAENLVLLGTRGLWSRTGQATRALREAGERLGHELNLTAPVGSLTFGDRQRVEIALMLAVGAETLVLDEPTACLGPEDAAQLATTIRSFVGDGGSVVYISHKLREVMDLADRVTVLRRGNVVAHHPTLGDLTAEQLGREMIGDLAAVPNADAHEMVEIVTADRADVPATSKEADLVCELRSVVVSPRAGVGNAPRREPLAGASLEVRAGEILGIAGVVGSGQQTLAEVLVGLTDVDDGKVIRKSGPVAYVPEARRRDAIAVQMSVSENLIVHTHRERALSAGPFLSRMKVDRFAGGLVERYAVRTASIGTPIGALSGGNQQRAVVGRELQRSPVLVVAHNPFRGLDVLAIHDVEQELLAAADRGAGVVLLSPDLDEIHRVCTRIAVLFAGRIVGVVNPRTTTNQEVGRLMGGAL